MVRVIIKVQELFQLQETIPRHDISNCRKSQHRAPIIKILCTFCYAQQHVHANKSLYLFPVSVHISPCFLYIVYKLVFSTTKLIKESGKKDKKYWYRYPICSRRVARSTIGSYIGRWLYISFLPSKNIFWL